MSIVRFPYYTGATRQWSPAVDIQVDDNQYMITADIPGVRPEDIEVTMDRGVLTIRGERSSSVKSVAADQGAEPAAESAEERGSYRRAERFRGKFQRSFTLPEDVDGDSITATGKDGVLEVRIPKVEQAGLKRIPVAA